MLDLTFSSPDIECYWSLDADTSGSDHFPILLDLPQMGQVPRKVPYVTNWDRFCHLLVSCSV